MVELGIGGLSQASEIGVGASAVVYRALQIDLDREVAVKVLSATDEAFVRRFKREAKTLGKLSLNPGIVTVHGTGVTESGHPYLILELCESSVLDHLKASGPFSPDAACRAGVEVADAVSDAHRNGVIHRDIKPGNILLSQSGNYLITDFGISTVTGSTLGQTESVGFTAGYVAPETLRGEEAGTPADVYALGATLFHMLSGHAPFVDRDRTSNLLALAQRVINDPVPDLRPLGVPEDICRIIEGAMAKHPMDRPTAAQLRDQLQAVLRSDLTAVPAVAAAPVKPTDPTKSPRTPIIAAAAGHDVHADAGPTVVGTPSDDFVPSRRLLSGTGDHPESGQYQAPPPAPLPLPQITRQPWIPVLVGGFAALLFVVGAVAAFVALRSDGGTALDASGDTPNAPSTSTSSGDDAGGDGNSGGQDGNGNVGTLPPGGTTSTTERLPEFVPVQDVSGMTVPAAGARLRQFGLVIKVVEREDPDSTSGLVIDQRPAFGTEARVGSTVTLFVATDRSLETVKVPTLVNLTAAQASEMIVAAGLKKQTTAEFDASVAEGNVVSVAPPAGTAVEVGSVVSVVISKGPRPTECGQVVGMTEAAAKSLLEDAGLTATVNRVESATAPAGEVIGCTVADTAVLTVSDGPNVCTSVIGTGLAAGTAALEAKDLAVTSTPVPNGTVPAQQILSCEIAGTTASIDYAVALPTTCPAAVDGATVAEARAALRAAGFTDITAELEPSETAPEGTVVSCTVAGSSVTLTVSSGPAASRTGDLTVTFIAITVREACAGDGLRPDIYGSLGFAYDGDPKPIWANRPRGDARTPTAAGVIAFNAERTWSGVSTGESLSFAWDLRDADKEGRAGDEDGEDDAVSAGTRALDLTGEDRVWRPAGGAAGPCSLQFTIDISWTNLSS